MPGTYNAGDQVASANLATPGWTSLTPLNSWTGTIKYRYHPLLHVIEIWCNITAGNTTTGTIIASGITPHPAHETNLGVAIDSSGNLLWAGGVVTTAFVHQYHSTDA